jgi:hypothetical protein
LEDRFIQIFDSTTEILTAVEQLVGQSNDEGGEYFHNELPGWVAIPPELEDSFTTLAQLVYPDLSAIPLDRGISAAIFNFNKVTSRPDQPVQSKTRYLFAIIDIMKTAWILRTVKVVQEYQITANRRSVNAFQNQLDQWGMTLERFFYKFEEVIYSV